MSNTGKHEVAGIASTYTVFCPDSISPDVLPDLVRALEEAGALPHRGAGVPADGSGLFGMQFDGAEMEIDGAACEVMWCGQMVTIERLE